MIDAERTRVLASSLPADGYQLGVAGCLVPTDLMRGILGQAFGIPRTPST